MGGNPSNALELQESEWYNITPYEKVHLIVNASTKLTLLP